MHPDLRIIKREKPAKVTDLISEKVDHQKSSEFKPVESITRRTPPLEISDLTKPEKKPKKKAANFRPIKPIVCDKKPEAKQSQEGESKNKPQKGQVKDASRKKQKRPKKLNFWALNTVKELTGCEDLEIGFFAFGFCGQKNYGFLSTRSGQVHIDEYGYHEVFVEHDDVEIDKAYLEHPIKKGIQVIFSSVSQGSGNKAPHSNFWIPVYEVCRFGDRIDDWRANRKIQGFEKNLKW